MAYMEIKDNIRKYNEHYTKPTDIEDAEVLYDLYKGYCRKWTDIQI